MRMLKALLLIVILLFLITAMQKAKALSNEPTDEAALRVAVKEGMMMYMESTSPEYGNNKVTM